MANIKYLDYEGLSLLVTKIKAGDTQALADAKAYVGSIPAGATQTDAISYLMAEIAKAQQAATFSGKAEDVTIADANNKYNATNVEDALAEVKTIADTNATNLATVMSADATTVGSIAKALKDAKDYTDTEIGTLKIGETTYSTVKEYVDAKDAAVVRLIDATHGDLSDLTTDAKTDLVVAINEVDAHADANAAAIGSDEEATTVKGRIKLLEDAIGEGGGVSEQIKNAIEALDSTVTNHVDATEEVPNPTQPDVEVTVTEVDGKLTAVSATFAGDRYDKAGSAATAKSEAIAASAVTISTDSTTEGALKTYTFTQNGAEIGKIDLAKDLVVTSGRVVKNPEGQPAGTYLELTIANQEAKVYINVLDLVNDFTVEENAEKVQLAISDTREISADIVAGSIERTDIDADFEADLAAVETALGAKTEGAFVSVANQINAKAKDAVYKAATEEASAVTIASAIASLEAAVGEGGAVADQIKAAIEALDSDASQTAGADGLALSVAIADGKLTSISGSIAANTYDTYGAAIAVQGATTATVKDVEDKVNDIGAIPTTDIEALFNPPVVTE